MGRNHLRVLLGSPDISEVLVYDQVKVPLPLNPLVSRAAKFEDLLNASLDYVVVALPTALHLKSSLQLSQSQTSTLLEKPVAQNLDDSIQIRDSFLDSGTTCAVGHVERFNPAISMLRTEIAKGTIGIPSMISTQRVGPYSGRIKDVGVVLDLASHDFDIVQFCLQVQYDSVSGILGSPLGKEYEDIFVGQGMLKSGAIVQHSVNWTSPTKVRKVEVLGDKGMLVADALRVELRLFKNGSVGSDWTAYENLRGVSEGEEVKFVVPAKEPLLLEHLAMKSEILSPGSTDICTISEAVETMKVAEMALRGK